MKNYDFVTDWNNVYSPVGIGLTGLVLGVGKGFNLAMQMQAEANAIHEAELVKQIQRKNMEKGYKVGYSDAEAGKPNFFESQPEESEESSDSENPRNPNRGLDDLSATERANLAKDGHDLDKLGEHIEKRTAEVTAEEAVEEAVENSEVVIPDEYKKAIVKLVLDEIDFLAMAKSQVKDLVPAAIDKAISKVVKPLTASDKVTKTVKKGNVINVTLHGDGTRAPGKSRKEIIRAGKEQDKQATAATG